jgi:hypothetical protein
MKTEEYRNRLVQLDSILQDSIFLLNNEELPIYNSVTESYPDEIPLVFHPARQTAILTNQAILDPAGEVVAVDNYLTRNFSCRLCPDRDRGIRGFLQRGRKKLLILHYTGDSGLTGSSFIKKNSRSLFRTPDVESCFQELVEKHLNLSYEEFFFQEYPACHFPKNSEPKQWEIRSKNCDIHVLETVQKENIKAILVLGSSAILRWSKTFCQTNQGKILTWKFGDGTTIPFSITRSPEALLHAKKSSPDKFPEIFQEMGRHLTELERIAGGFD